MRTTHSDTHSLHPCYQSESIPVFSLYGEPSTPAQDLLHVEEIQSRSRHYGWRIDTHFHRGLYQVVWLKNGPACISLDGLYHECDGPIAVIIPPGTIHGFQFTENSDGKVLTLSDRSFVDSECLAVGNSLRDLFKGAQILKLDDEDFECHRLEHLFLELSAEFQAPDTTGEPISVWLARSVIWRLARICARDGNIDDPMTIQRHALFTKFTLIVEEHYTEHWPVSRYARFLGLTSERLNRLVRSQTGSGALDMLHKRLLREACRRLIYVSVSIKELAFELGFHDPGYFCRFFKRHTGLSPRDFRATQQRSQ